MGSFGNQELTVLHLRKSNFICSRNQNKVNRYIQLKGNDALDNECEGTNREKTKKIDTYYPAFLLLQL